MINRNIVSKVQVRVFGMILLFLAFIIFMPPSNEPNYGQAIYTLFCGGSLFFVVILLIIDTWRVMSLERRKQRQREINEIVEKTSIPQLVLSDKN